MTNDFLWQERTHLLLGDEKLIKLRNSNVLIVGLGGVGAYAAEMICRAGVGTLTIIDGDVVEVSNRNRQLPALASTQGMPKAEVMAARLKDINPDVKLSVINDYITHDKFEAICTAAPYNFVVDAIDTIAPKVQLIYQCVQNNIPLVSSMGAGAKMDPSFIKVTDISQSYNCRLAFVMRKRLRPLGIKKGVTVVFTSEDANPKAIKPIENETNKKSTVGTISYMPAIMGCTCASVVIRSLCES